MDHHAGSQDQLDKDDQSNPEGAKIKVNVDNAEVQVNVENVNLQGKKPDDQSSGQAARKRTWIDWLIVGVLVLIVVGVCIASVMLWQSFRKGQETVTVTETPTTCERIYSSGKLIVGVSADYPPFEFYTPDFVLDGFDIALMRQVASRMGLQVEFRDMAFDGLADAISLGQIDAAISALTVTPERAAKVSFSNAYFVSQAGVLIKADSQIPTITNTTQIAPYRTGVQAGSVFQAWIEANLIETNLMPKSYLFVYPRIDQALNDLNAGVIQIVLVDGPVANTLATAGDVKVAGDGGSLQIYAIAAPKECTSLVERINQTLTQLQAEGVVAQLASQYIGVKPDEIVPAPTPTPIPIQPTLVAPTPTAPPACRNNMAFVKDLNYPDNKMKNPAVLPAGTPFQKGWRVRNTGTCTWDSRYSLRYTDGNTPYSSMGGQPTNIFGTVPPNAVYDIYVNLVAPLYPGVYQGFWELFSPEGASFGDRIWVGIQVPPNNPSTPTPRPDAPSVFRFTIDPASIQVGRCATLSWQVNGKVNNVSITRNGLPFYDNAPAFASTSDCPPAGGVYSYLLTAQGPYGSTSAERQLLVSDIPPTPTQPLQPPPFITYFSVSPGQILTQECVNINWGIDGTVASARLLRNGQPILDNAPSLGNAQDCISNAGTYVYRLEASGAGQSTSREAVVEVIAPQPTAIPAPDFVNIPWTLQELWKDGAQQSPIPGTYLTVTFDSNGKVIGSAGCNQFQGTYTVSGSYMSIRVASMTQKICAEPPGIMEQENIYLMLLNAVTGYQSYGTSLVLASDQLVPGQVAPALAFSLAR